MKLTQQVDVSTCGGCDHASNTEALTGTAVPAFKVNTFRARRCSAELPLACYARPAATTVQHAFGAGWQALCVGIP
eukprot:2358025-Pyramimonas_sp.AAC.1